MMTERLRIWHLIMKTMTIYSLILKLLPETTHMTPRALMELTNPQFMTQDLFSSELRVRGQTQRSDKDTSLSCLVTCNTFLCCHRHTHSMSASLLSSTLGDCLISYPFIDRVISALLYQHVYACLCDVCIPTCFHNKVYLCCVIG